MMEVGHSSSGKLQGGEWLAANMPKIGAPGKTRACRGTINFGMTELLLLASPGLFLSMRLESCHNHTTHQRPG